ncbi:MAG: DUF885 domain-containing protein [SAR86 cluster bacterium]|uniref:DUF885 domain-containing protein n=1 Tax=SAR86 cluster bacterium TaxID=2030880 RepID=A0A2A4XEZ4_9GAMM|nr:MAG: DUF885 domain-containing protein [SAR86 cluster bacterium]
MRALLSVLITVLVSCSDNNVSSSSSQPSEANSLASVEQLTANESLRFMEWLDEEYAEEVDFSPLLKTRQGDKSAHGELDDVSEVALDARLEWRRTSVAEMRSSFDRDQLDKQGQLSWDLWQYALIDAERSEPFRRHRYIFGRNGSQSSLANSLINYQEVGDASDMRDYISRLNQSQRYLLQYLDRAKLAAADGIRAPHFDYQQAISEARRVTSGAPFDEQSDSALWADITAKIDNLIESEQINPSQAESFQEESRSALLTRFKPALDEIVNWLVADLENVSDVAKGAWSLPNGEAYYNSRLASMTTLPLTANEIHDIGISEVARIQAEMEQIKRQVGFEGTLQDFFTYMREDDQFYFPSNDEGRTNYLNLADDLLADMYERLPDYFGILPKAGLQVRRVEAFRETPGGAAHYARGTKDGSRPGTFYAHLIDMRAASIFRLENLAYHEGVPGHHMQISIQQELENIPRFRTAKGYTAFSEGWGLYAEYLGKEMGFYNDPYAEFGRLSGEIWRAVRLVVDTGIHAKQWTQEQATDYALQNSARPEPSVRSEIRRYFNNPGQATAYKIGMLKIQEVRAKAENELGAEFDIRDFHDTVLGSGQLPMAVLEAEVDSWIESVRN